jgi:hypothetical protein
MREKSYAKVIFVAVLLMEGLALSQTAQQSGTLTVAGHSGEAPVIQANGRSYVDIETLARLTSGSLSFNGNQIKLTLPGGTADTTRTVPPDSHSAKAGFSKDFLRASIEAMAEIREWRSALDNAVQYGFPVGNNWIAGYQGAASTAIRLASVAASTNADRSASQLLNNVYANMQKLSDKMLAARKNMNYIAPDALLKDPLDQKILACARSLASMAASGQFQDDSSCH